MVQRSRRKLTFRTEPDEQSSGSGATRQGQAFIEFALGLPLMLLIMLGTLDVGQVFIDYVQLRNGCREAAAYGSRHPTEYGNISSRVTSEDPMMTYSTTTVSVTINGNLDVTSDSRTQLVVVCERTFTPITMGFLQEFWGIGQFALQATSTAQVQK